ncbi:MAG: chromate transporter [Endozoicomonas sp.]
MLLKLFLTFFRLGAVTFGGGYAMMALLEQELVDNHEWLSADELLEITAIAQITPGTIAINAATFVGRRVAGIPGAIIASIAIVLPPLLIVGLLSGYMAQWMQDSAFQGAFLAIRYAVAALILHAAYKMLLQGVTSWLGRALFLVALLTLMFTPVHPLLLIMLGGGIGLALYVARALPGQREAILKSEGAER